MLRQTLSRHGWHYVHPKTGRPIKQKRRFGDPRYINNEAAVIENHWGLITADFGMVSASQLENARLAVLRRLPRGSFNLVMHTDYQEYAIVRKSPESRKGGGKSNIHHFAFKFTTGIPLMEIVQLGTARLHQSEAEAIMQPARLHIPIQTAVVPQGRVDEYSVFK